MFERWTDVVGGAVVAIGIAYIAYEVDRRQKKLREVFYLLEGEDRAIFDELEEMARTGLLTPDQGAAL